MATEATWARNTIRNENGGDYPKSKHRVVDSQGDVKAWDRFTVRAFEIVAGQRVRVGFDLKREHEDRFGRAIFDQSMFLALRLVDAGVSYVTVRVRNRDLHLDVVKKIRKIDPPFDQGVTAVVSDLYERGMVREVLVMVMGEFGRTRRTSDRGRGIGRAHWLRVFL